MMGSFLVGEVVLPPTIVSHHHFISGCRWCSSNKNFLGSAQLKFYAASSGSASKAIPKKRAWQSQGASPEKAGGNPRPRYAQ